MKLKFLSFRSNPISKQRNSDSYSNSHRKSGGQLMPNPMSAIVLAHSQLASLPDESFSQPNRGTAHWQTLLSSPLTNSNSFTVGIATCSAKSGFLAPHRHEQAEIYHIISGSGLLRIEGQDFAIATGDVIFIPGNAEHSVSNEMGEQELKWLYCFGVDKFEDVVYRFTGEQSC